MGQGYVDVEGLLGHSTSRALLHELEGAHVVKAIGQFDHQDADVFRHRDEHLSKVLGLAFAGGLELDLRDLGETLDEEAHLIAELLGDLLDRAVGVLHRVVEEAGADGGGVHAHVREDPGHLQGVDQVGLSGEALLPVMNLGGVDVGLLQQPKVAVRIVFQHPVGDVIEAQHMDSSSLFAVYPP